MTNIGVRKGCSLSPTLFNIYIDDIIQNWKELHKEGIYLDKDTILNVILYADDLTLIGKKRKNCKRDYTNCSKLAKDTI